MSLEEILTEYRLWLMKTAWRYSNGNNKLDDLVQEGAIAIWQAHREWTPDNKVPLHTFLYNKAKWRMAQVAKRETYSGRPSQRGKNSHATAENEHSHGDLTAAIFERAEWKPEPVIAYHTPEIIAAINTLPLVQRQKVYEYFWLDMPNGNGWSWWNRKKSGARDRLRPQLEHLQDLAR